MIEVIPGGGCPGAAHFPQPAVVGLDLPVVLPVEPIILHMVVGPVVVVVAGGGAGSGTGRQAGKLFFHEAGTEVQAAVVIEPVIAVHGKIPPGAVHVGAAVVVFLPDLGQVEVKVHVELPHVPGGKASVNGRFQASGTGPRIAALGLILFGDDIDHAGYGITAVEGGRGAADHLDAVDPGRVDDVEIDLPAEVAHQPLAINEDQDVPAREATHLHRGAHIAPAEVNRRDQPGEDL